MLQASHVTHVKMHQESTCSDGREFTALMNTLQQSIPLLPLTVTSADHLISVATQITVRDSSTRAKCKPCTRTTWRLFHIQSTGAKTSTHVYTKGLSIISILQMATWSAFKEHMAHTCKVKFMKSLRECFYFMPPHVDITPCFKEKAV